MMNLNTSKVNKSMRTMRWTARGISLVMIILTLAFIIAEVMNSKSGSEPVPVLMIVFGTFLLGGLAIAWKWELIGGIVSLIGFIGIDILNPDVLTKPMMYLYAVAAVLFLVCWWESRTMRS